MLNGYKKLDNLPFIKRYMQAMNKMKAELHEHRYYLEANVERRSEQLLKQISMLESCNESLSEKLTQAHQKIIVLKQQLAHALPDKNHDSGNSGSKLYAISNLKNLREKF